MNATPPVFAEGEFRKAHASQPNKECVQVARREGWVEIRDDKKTFGAADDHRLVFTSTQFDAFLSSVRSGEAGDRCLQMTPCASGYIFRNAEHLDMSTHTTQLEFTEGEVAAFVDGISRHEFDLVAYAGI